MIFQYQFLSIDYPGFNAQAPDFTQHKIVLRSDPGYFKCSSTI